MAALRLCSIPDCGKRAKSGALCSMHYERKRVYGSPDGGQFHHGARMRFLTDTALHWQSNSCLYFPKSLSRKIGYPTVRNDGLNTNASRIVCRMAHGEPPSTQHEAAHSCGNGHLGCINPKHLRWATHIENVADRTIHGTTARGERMGLSKLSESDVREIRALRGKVSIVKLASVFGVSDTCISAIQLRKSWAWLE